MAVLKQNRGAAYTKPKMMATIYSFIIMSSLSTEILAQQLLPGQTQVVNTVVTSGDDTSSLFGGFNSIYDNNNGVGSFDDQNIIQRQVITSSGTAQYPQAVAQANYPQIGIQTNPLIPQSGAQLYPTQVGYGYQPQNYGSMYGNNRAFNANYWTGSYNNFPKVLPVHRPAIIAPVVPPMRVIHRPVVHPGLVMPKRPRGKGFLGGTGNGVVKGVLGAVLAGVVAGKVARGK